MTSPSQAAQPAEYQRELGKRLRRDSPRQQLAKLDRSTDPAISILQQQNKSRIPELVPLRFARMLQEPFSFYRGAAAVMAADLAASPSSNLTAISCGDAHVSNFGLYASPARELVFDLNDFDEAAIAPWEWDLKRLATSAALGAEQLKMPKDRIKKCVERSISGYVDSLTRLLETDALTRFYLQSHPKQIDKALRPKDAEVLQHAIKSATKRTSARVFASITETKNDKLRLRENPPILEHLEARPRTTIEDWLEACQRTASPAVAMLLSQFRLVDVARRVVGVGSVGTRCYLAILLGPANEPLVLQLKQAEPSVLATFGKQQLSGPLTDAVRGDGEGARVIAIQRIMQATSDPFLVALRVGGVDLYVRQFHDMKGSLDVATMPKKTFEHYVTACGAQLARAHSQSAKAFQIAGYIGKGNKILAALTSFALEYAKATLQDFQQLRAAADRGDIEVSEQLYK